MTSAGLFILSATFLYDEKDSLAWLKEKHFKHISF